MKCFLGLALFCLTIPVFAQTSPLVQNLNFSAAIDATAPMNFDDSSENKLGIRSAEFMIYGAVDPTFDAMINFAAHNHDGEYIAELHEGYISSSKLIPDLRFKLGTFFLGVGRLNQFHQHDWPFITAPKVQSEFFDEEGVHDTGLEFTYLLPTETYWDITFGITNGFTFGEQEHGHEHADEDPSSGKPNVPTHYIRPSTFIAFEDGAGLQIGLNYLGRTDTQGLKTELSGLDFVYKKKEGSFNRWFFQSEIWYRMQNSAVTERLNEVGAYFYPEYGFTAQWAFGLRLDAFEEARNNYDYAFVPTVTYTHSEFSKWRLAYTHEVNHGASPTDQITRILELQFIAILGAHPAHSF